MKGVGRIYQTFVDAYSKVAFAKLYDRKSPITAADLLNDRLVPFFDSREVKLCCTLTDRKLQYCGNPERHEYEFYLAVADIDHSRTKIKSAQTNGIVEPQCRPLSRWLDMYNQPRPHSALGTLAPVVALNNLLRDHIEAQLTHPSTSAKHYDTLALD